MSTSEEISIGRALEKEQRMMQRQMLLKRLWKLKQQRADNNDHENSSDNTAEPLAALPVVPPANDGVARRSELPGDVAVVVQS